VRARAFGQNLQWCAEQAATASGRKDLPSRTKGEQHARAAPPSKNPAFSRLSAGSSRCGWPNTSITVAGRPGGRLGQGVDVGCIQALSARRRPRLRPAGAGLAPRRSRAPVGIFDAQRTVGPGAPPSGHARTAIR